MLLSRQTSRSTLMDRVYGPTGGGSDGPDVSSEDDSDDDDDTFFRVRGAGGESAAAKQSGAAAAAGLFRRCPISNYVCTHDLLSFMARHTESLSNNESMFPWRVSRGHLSVFFNVIEFV